MRPTGWVDFIHGAAIAFMVLSFVYGDKLFFIGVFLFAIGILVNKGELR